MASSLRHSGRLSNGEGNLGEREREMGRNKERKRVTKDGGIRERGTKEKGEKKSDRKKEREREGGIGEER